MKCLQSERQKNIAPDLFKKKFKVSSHKLDKILEKLNRREAFVKGQVFPYKIEFASFAQYGLIKSLELNIHYGPRLSLHGERGRILELHSYFNFKQVKKAL